MRIRLILLAAFTAFFVNASATQASVIGWGSAQNTLAPSDISTSGTLIAAFNGGDSSPTVNGVTFTASSVLDQGTFAGALDGGTTGNGDFNQLLNELTFGNGTSTSIDLGSFSAGNTYEVQVFYTDQRSGTNNRMMTYGSDDGVLPSGGTVVLEADPGNTTSSPFGQFAIGTFVADGNDPDLTLDTNGFDNAHINAWQVRVTNVVPEASAMTVWSLLTFVAYCYRRRSPSV